MKKVATTTTRYEDGEFYVDIVRIHTKYGLIYEAWLSHKEYGVSMLMYSLPSKGNTMDRILRIVEDGLMAQKESYKEMYMDAPKKDEYLECIGDSDEKLPDGWYTESKEDPFHPFKNHHLLPGWVSE